jgi:hypothetical protein
MPVFLKSGNMATILEMLKRLEVINMMEVAAEAIESTKEDLKEWQKEQLFAGYINDGKTKITPPYKASTRRTKARKGQPYDRVTLRDTGAFYEGIFIDVRNSTFVTDSTDEKSSILQDKYGSKIFGIGGVFKVGYIQELRPALMDNLRKRLKL